MLSVVGRADVNSTASNILVLLSVISGVVLVVILLSVAVFLYRYLRIQESQHCQPLVHTPVQKARYITSTPDDIKYDTDMDRNPDVIPEKTS